MGNFPRYIPAGSLVEITTRTVQGRLLLVPSRELNDIVCGILARALDRYDVELVDFTVLSNHVHLLAIVADAKALADFMCYVNGNLAKEAGRLHHWREKFWSRRYRAIVISDEPEAQIARLRYILENGCKEGLVRSPREWPGANGTEALLTGQPVRGWWFDRTAEYEARRKGERYSKYTHGTEESFSLVPLPSWRKLTAEEYRARVGELVRDIEAETRQRLREQGRSPMGRKRILRQNPHDKPRELEPVPGATVPRRIRGGSQRPRARVLRVPHLVPPGGRRATGRQEERRLPARVLPAAASVPRAGRSTGRVCDDHPGLRLPNRRP